MRIKRNSYISIFSVLVIFAIWFAVAFIAGEIRSVDFPTPLSTFLRLIDNLKGEEVYEHPIYQHTLVSLTRWVFAYLFAVFSGILIGFGLGIYPTMHRLFMPFVYTLQLVPGLAWIPIALLLFGLGEASTFFMIFILGLTPVIITTASGIRETSPDLIQASILMGAGRMMLFRHVLLPSALFHIIDGLRIALANSWRVLIAAEMIVGRGIGLGFIIIQSRWSLDYASAFVSIVIIVLFGLTTEKFLFNRIENNLRKKYGYDSQDKKAPKE